MPTYHVIARDDSNAKTLQLVLDAPDFTSAWNYTLDCAQAYSEATARHNPITTPDWRIESCTQARGLLAIDADNP